MIHTSSNRVYQRRVLSHRFGLFLSFCAMAAGLFFLGWILMTLLFKGAGAISIAMFSQSTPAPGDEGGGVANAILGSLMMVGVSTLISTPIGVLAGIYLAEYGERSRFAQLTRFIVDIMLSAPSIVIGLFIYAIYVIYVKHFSGWAGSFAISLIAVPVIVRTTDNMLNLVPVSLREAAYALGAPALEGCDDDSFTCRQGWNTHRSAAGRRADLGRNRTIALYCAKQPVFQYQYESTNGKLAGGYISICHESL